MKCIQIENKLVAYLEKALTTEDVNTIEEHLASCQNCKRALTETQAMLQAFEVIDDEIPGEGMRENFMQLLEEEKQLQQLQGIDRYTQKEFTWKTAFQIAASIVLLLCGYLFGNFQESKESEIQITFLRQETIQLKQEMMLAMLDNKSASKRIQAVSYTSELQTAPDTEVIEALIERLNFDGNVNVRLAAAEALSNYSKDEAVKTAFITSLTNEKNPTVQIAVIQFLVTTQDQRARAPMEKLLEETETPNYVKEQLNQGLQQLI